MTTSVQLNDFQPLNNWKPEKSGAKYCDGSPVFIVDQATHRRYWNESHGVIRFKCFLLTLGTPLIQSVAGVINMAVRIAKLVSLHHFWSPQVKGATFKARALHAASDLIRVAAAPLALIGMELAALYGIFNPLDGRKLYASIERGIYNGQFFLAPCFQPNPEKHFFGGDPHKKDQF